MVDFLFGKDCDRTDPLDEDPSAALVPGTVIYDALTTSFALDPDTALTALELIGKVRCDGHEAAVPATEWLSIGTATTRAWCETACGMILAVHPLAETEGAMIVDEQWEEFEVTVDADFLIDGDDLLRIRGDGSE